jgi:hypothetical protein
MSRSVNRARIVQLIAVAVVAGAVFASSLPAFAANGTFSTQWNPYGSAPGTAFREIKGVAASASSVYVAGSSAFLQLAPIQRFSLDGTWIGTLAAGPPDWEVTAEHGLAADNAGNVYMNGLDVHKWNPDGSYAGTFAMDALGHDYPSAAPYFMNELIDVNGPGTRVVIGESGQPSDGDPEWQYRTIRVLNGAGAKVGDINTVIPVLTAIAVDPDGNVYAIGVTEPSSYPSPMC